MAAFKTIFILFLILSIVPKVNPGPLGFLFGGSACICGCTVTLTICLGGTAAAAGPTAGAAIPVGTAFCTVSFNTCVGTCTIAVTVATGPV